MEKERELELGEKLNEQRKILEGEHAEALRGKEKMHLEGQTPQFHLPSSHGTPIFPSHPPLVPKQLSLQDWSLQGPKTCPFGLIIFDPMLCISLVERCFSFPF